MDIFVMVDQYPAKGDTVLGKKIEIQPGGKGANQAVACANFGNNVHLIGSVGNDSYGDQLLEKLSKLHVGTQSIKRSMHHTTGTTVITLDDNAENTIISIKGANDDLDIDHVRNFKHKIEKCKLLLAQMEIPEAAIIEAMKVAKKSGTFILLDPAPADAISEHVLKYADLITPNLQETKHITGIAVTDYHSAFSAAQMIEKKLGIGNSIIKMGEKGSLVYQKGNATFIEAIKVKAIDTVGAGDCYAGAIASGLVNGNDLVSCAKFATVASALKVTKFGAQEGIPSMKEISDFSKEMGLTNYLLDDIS